MSNKYFTHPNRLTPYSTARAEEVNDIFDAIASGMEQVEVDITTEAGLLQASSAADRTAAEVARTGAESARDAAQVSQSSATTQAGIATTQAGIATTGANTATTQAGIATTGANTATTQAGIATTGANTATTQAGIATTGANTATTQAGIATGAANNALASELKAADWAEKPTAVEPGKYSAKFWADQAQSSIVNVLIDDATTNTDKTWSSQKISGDLSGKQATLVSGANIKTINSTSILGAGDIVASGFPLSTTTTGANKTLANGEFCTVTASGRTITLPANPSAGWLVAISVLNFTNTVIGRNTQNIMGLAENMTIDKANVTVTLCFVDATRGWRIV